MSCNFKVECITPKEIPEEQMQDIICSKIANVIISKEKENYTFVEESNK